MAAAAQIDRSTIYDILAGRSWPDTVTLAKLERHLNLGLWPTHPRPAPAAEPPDEPATTRSSE